MKVVIYHEHIYKVGGVSSAVLNLIKGLDKKGYEVVIAFRSCQDPLSLFQFAKYCSLVNTSEGNVKGDVCLIASNHKAPEEIKVKRYLQWIHSDYDKYGFTLDNMDLYHEGVLDYVAVSEYTKKVIERREDVKVKYVVYNLLDTEFGSNPEPLRLVTASRIAPEKGFARALKFAQLLKKKEIPFVWVVYGDNQGNRKEERKWVQAFTEVNEVYFVGYKEDITPVLKQSDYLVMLSDFEGCPYCVLEALSLNIPCIVSDWNGVEEIIEDGVNGYILPMDMNIDSGYVDKIVNKIPEFKYKPLSGIKDWDKLLQKANELPRV